MHLESECFTIRFFGNYTFLATLKEIVRGKWKARELGAVPIGTDGGSKMAFVVVRLSFGEKL